MTMTAEIFYQLAAQEVREITFPTKKHAERYRLRLYRVRNMKGNEHWPRITILWRENKLIAGPEFFDMEMEMDEGTKKAVEEFEKQNADKEVERAERIRMEGIERRKAANPFDLLKEKEAAIETTINPDDMYEQEGNKE